MQEIKRERPLVIERRRRELPTRLFYGPKVAKPVPLPTFKLKTHIHLSYTFNQADPDDWSQVINIAFQKGHRYDVWVQAVKERIRARGGSVTEVQETATTVRFTGQSVLDLGSLCNRCTVADRPTPSGHVDAIRARSTINTEVGTFTNYESISHSPYWNPAGDPLYEAAKLAIYLTPEPNGYVAGNQYQHGPARILDYYEQFKTGTGWDAWYNPFDEAGVLKDPWPDIPRGGAGWSKHIWLCDTLKEDLGLGGIHAGWGYPKYFAEVAFPEYLDAAHTNLDGKLDYIYFDQMYTHGPHKFGATNDVDRDPETGYTNARYISGWHTMLFLLAAQLAGSGPGGGDVVVGGNATPKSQANGGPWDPTIVKLKWVEHMFRNTAGNGAGQWSEIVPRFQDLASESMQVHFGAVKESRTKQAWFTTDEGPGVQGGIDYGTWTQLTDLVEAGGNGANTYVDVGRSTPDGWLFWNTAMVDPREYV